MIKNDIIASEMSRKIRDIVFAVTGKYCSEENLFLGTTNIPIERVLSRHFLYYVLKDKCGYTYTEIHCLSGKGMRGIMKAVHKVREYIFMDPLYSIVGKAINKTLGYE